MSAKLRSTEFSLSAIAIIVGMLLGAGIIGDHSIYATIGGWAMAALASAGYTTARTLAKAADGAGKPGYKTTEFWKAVAVAVLVWAQAHVVPPGSQWAEIIGYILTTLPLGTYAIARGSLKASPPPSLATTYPPQGCASGR